MQKLQPLKYTLAFSLYIVAYIAFTIPGYWTFALVIYGYGIIPFLEFFYKPNFNNTEPVKESNIYDYLLYLMVPLHFLSLIYFFYSVNQPHLETYESIGRILTMGTICGHSINIAHELGHRGRKLEQNLAKMLLLGSLYMHFIIEHNRGHHKRAATLEDPATARKGEILYFFLFRSIFYSYVSAWKLEYKRLKERKKKIFSLENEMIQFEIIQTLFCGFLLYFFGLTILLYFLSVSLMGIILLESINYVEHYGLLRKKDENGKYEKITPMHSWNANITLGRIMLFELSRHSDHHLIASKKYQTLESHDDSPELPSGYIGMILLSFFPPVWFWVVNPLLEEINNSKK
jgi:alkane 1-monooxygenase